MSFTPRSICIRKIHSYLFQRDLKRKRLKASITFECFPKFLSQNQINDLDKFKVLLKAANKVVILSDAGISAESGVPTFRGQGGLWRKLEAPLLASPAAFRDDPGLVWEFYHYRRELVLNAKPNAGHIAIAEYEAKHASDKIVTVITQNVDGLHSKAGSKNIIELHGNLFKTRCTKCDEVLVNTDSPIYGALSKCKVCLVVGTSSLVYPAAGYPLITWAAGAVVAEFNIEPAPSTPKFDFYFEGPSATTLPLALYE